MANDRTLWQGSEAGFPQTLLAITVNARSMKTCIDYLSGWSGLIWKGKLPDFQKLIVLLASALEAGAMTCSVGGCFIEKKELGIAVGAHQLTLDTIEGQVTCDPALELKEASNLLTGIM